MYEDLAVVIFIVVLTLASFWAYISALSSLAELKPDRALLIYADSKTGEVKAFWIVKPTKGAIGVVVKPSQSQVIIADTQGVTK